MKKVKTLLLANLLALSILMLGITPILAKGDSPYGPHVPVPTGFGDIESVALIGAVSYLGGVTLMSYAQVVKNKLAK